MRPAPGCRSRCFPTIYGPRGSLPPRATRAGCCRGRPPTGPRSASWCWRREPAPCATPAEPEKGERTWQGKSSRSSGRQMPGRSSPPSRVRRRKGTSTTVTVHVDSCFGPIADQVVINAGKLHGLRIVSADALDQPLNGGIEVEYQAARMGIADHALQPEERRHPDTTGDRRHHMQARRRVEDQISGRQLYRMGAVEVLDNQFSAVVLIRLRKKQRDRQIGAQAHAGQRIAADRVVDMNAEMMPGANCSLFLTIADCAPAVERPSSHSHASMTPRNSATSALLSTFGTQINIVDFSPSNFSSRVWPAQSNRRPGPARSERTAPRS